MIPYGRQSISEQDIQAVVEVLRSDFLTQGPVVPRFEEKLASYVGSKHGVAVNSATSALHIACLALGVGPGDVVWTSPTTFVASANCALYCGAAVDFVDVDSVRGNMNVDMLERKLVNAAGSDRLPKVVIPVHLTGHSCDMRRIHELSRRYGFRIIEDASHAVGASYGGTKVGSCQYSDIAVLSFHPVKLITTGEGGMAMTNDDEYAERMRLFRSHGITRDPTLFRQAPAGPWHYEQIELGFNYRMTDISAALGLSQMSRLDEFVARRNAIAKQYAALLSNLNLGLPEDQDDVVSSFHLYVIRTRYDDEAKHRQLFSYLRANGIGVNLHYMPVHLQPYYRNLGFCEGQFPEAEKYVRQAISIPLFPDLGDRKVAEIAEKVATGLSSVAQ